MGKRMKYIVTLKSATWCLSPKERVDGVAQLVERQTQDSMT